jgi:hypothetical protein
MFHVSLYQIPKKKQHSLFPQNIFKSRINVQSIDKELKKHTKRSTAAKLSADTLLQYITNSSHDPNILVNFMQTYIPLFYNGRKKICTTKSRTGHCFSQANALCT